MKQFNFNPNVLTAGVALALGLGIASSVPAATTSGGATATTGVQISNTATAVYSVDNVVQPTVTSNAVIVNINETGSFSLVATQGTSTTDDKNEAAGTTPALTSPSGSVTFTNTLTNTGNVKDTYTINLSDTAGNIITGVTDAFGFTNEDTTPIAVTIKNKDGSTASTTTITSGGQINLLPGQYAELSYSLTADGTGVGGQSGLATISATSSYIGANPTTGASATLTNEDQALLKLPVFAITKTAANNNIDLNATTSFDYTITVKNDGSATYAADATNILIQDAIPAGLALDVTKPITVSGIADTTFVTSNSTATLLKVEGVDLKVNETVTIKFTVKVTDKAALSAAGSVVNNADVYDNYDSSNPDPANPQIWDSTSTTATDKPQVGDDPNGSGTGGDTPSTVSFTNRNLTMTQDTTKELAPTGSTTVTHTILNLGNQAEGDVAGELVLTIADGTPSNTTVQPAPTTASTLDDIVVTIKDSTGITVATKTFPSGTTSIDFNSVSAGGIPVGGTATVTYTEVSTNNYDTTTQNPLVASDTTKLTLTPTGSAAPSPIVNTDTFNVKDMDLVKTQALDANCDGTADAAFGTTAVTAKPSECVIYRITATNNFTTMPLTNVVISDSASNWSAKATYVSGSIKDSAGGVTTAPGATAISSALTIPANSGTGWLQFAIKINQ
ncbi:MAG: hypothetical protein ACRC7U_09685 [Moraxella sp.]